MQWSAAGSVARVHACALVVVRSVQAWAEGQLCLISECQLSRVHGTGHATARAPTTYRRPLSSAASAAGAPALLNCASAHRSITRSAATPATPAPSPLPETLAVAPPAAAAADAVAAGSSGSTTGTIRHRNASRRCLTSPIILRGGAA